MTKVEKKGAPAPVSSSLGELGLYRCAQTVHIPVQANSTPVAGAALAVGIVALAVVVHRAVVRLAPGFTALLLLLVVRVGLFLILGLGDGTKTCEEKRHGDQNCQK